MSYLDAPRLHFHGTFFTNPSTINNRITNMEPGANPDDGTWNPSWNPDGVARFHFQDCTIGAGVDPQGQTRFDGDPLINATLQTITPDNADDPMVKLAATSGSPRWTGFTAKMADIDTDLQMQDSALYGIWIFVQLPTEPGQAPAGFYGRLGIPYVHNAATTSLNEVNVANRYNLATGGCWQSTIEEVIWTGDYQRSALLALMNKYWQEGAVLPDGGICSGALSMKFVVSLYNTNLDDEDNQGDQFGYGRVTGTIGPALQNEPEYFPPGRYLYNNQTAVGGLVSGANINMQVKTLNGKPTLTADLSNSLYQTFAAPPYSGKFREDIHYEIGLMTNNSVSDDFTPLTNGKFTVNSSCGLLRQQYRSTEQKYYWYLPGGGIYSIELTPAERDKTRTQLLAIRFNGAVRWKEQKDALYIGMLDRVVRLQQGYQCNALTIPAKELINSGQVQMLVSSFGHPVANQPLSQYGVKTVVTNKSGESQWYACTIGYPHENTDDNGHFKMNICFKDEANFTIPEQRDRLGSILNFVTGVAGSPWIDDANEGNYPLAVLLWQKYDIPVASEITWAQDVYPILGFYAQTYPGMVGILDIGDECDVLANYQRMLGVFSADPFDASFMPVTRDMSPYKMQMITDWLNQNGGKS